MNRKSTASSARIKFHYYLFILCFAVAVALCGCRCLCVCVRTFHFGQHEKEEETKNQKITDTNTRTHTHNAQKRLTDCECKYIHVNGLCRLHRRRRLPTYIKRLNLRPFFGWYDRVRTYMHFPSSVRTPHSAQPAHCCCSFKSTTSCSTHFICSRSFLVYFFLVFFCFAFILW